MIRNTFILTLLFLASLAIAQIPETIQFQAAATQPDGSTITNQEIFIRMSLIQNQLNPINRFTEVHHVTTNELGHFQLQIGDGYTVDGSMENVKWESGNIILKIEVDADGGSNYQILGETPLSSVPYAMHAASAASLKSSDVLELSSDQDIVLSFVRNFEIATANQTAIFVNESGKVGLGTKDLDDDDRKDIEIGVNKRVWGYSDQWHLDKSGVFNMQAVDSFSKPAIVWYSPTKTRQAALVAHIESHGVGTHNHWSVETANESGELFTRFEIPICQDEPTIQTHSAHFKVADNFDFITTGKMMAYGNNKIGFGDKDWENVGVFGNCKWEFYRSENTASFLIHQGDGSKNAELLLKSGNNIWTITHNGKLNIQHNEKTALSITKDGNVGIGTEEPQSKLHVDGDVSISSGHSYKTAGADFAEYFPASEELQIGDVAGINLENGMLRKYREGDELLGVVSEDAGFVGNVKPINESEKMVMVGLIGQLEFDKGQTIIENGYVYTIDKKKIGVLLANGKVFLKQH